MDISVESFLHDTRMWNLSLVAGIGGLSKTVTKVTVMDAPDGPHWLKGGEFILTSTYMFNNDTDRLCSFCMDLVDSKASAFGLKMGRYLSSLPQALIDLCDRVNLPLIIIPYSLVWTDIISVFYEISYDLSRPQKYSTIKERMVRRLSESSSMGPQHIADSIYSFFETPIAFLGKDRSFVACCGSDAEREELRESISSMAGERTGFKPRYYYSGRYYCSGFYSGSWSEVQYVVFSSDSATILDELKGIMVKAGLLIPERKGMPETEDDLYYNALSILLSETRLDSDIIDNLNKRSLLNKGNFCLVYITPCTGQNVKTYFLDAVSKIQDIDIKFCMVNNPLRREAIAILRFSKKTENSRSELALRTIIAEVEGVISEAGSPEHIFVSNRYGSFNRLEQCYHEAVTTRDYCQIINDKYKPGFFSEIYPYYLLMNSDMAPAYLDDLEDLDGAGNLISFDAIATLEAYLRCGVYKTAAAELYIHENTLRYRIKKIEEMLRIDFDDTAVCRDFILRINLWKLKKNLK